MSSNLSPIERSSAPSDQDSAFRHERRTDVGGRSVAWHVGSVDGVGPPLVLVHGGRAHRGWWDHLAPLLNHPWAALDLSGHGDSSWQPPYGYELWAEEVTAVCAAFASICRSKVVVVGHSLGGIVSLMPTVDESGHVRGVISVDGAPMPAFPSRRSTGPATYATESAAIEHFRHARNRSRWQPTLVDSVARASVRATVEGWSWKHDPRTVGITHPAWKDGRQLPAAIVLGQQSVLRDLLEASPALRSPSLRRIPAPGLGHDMMMEQPETFVELLELALDGFS